MPQLHSTINPKTDNPYRLWDSFRDGFGLTLSSFGCLDFTATDGQRRGPR